jgi:hypothetical protein
MRGASSLHHQTHTPKPQCRNNHYRILRSRTGFECLCFSERFKDNVRALAGVIMLSTFRDYACLWFKENLKKENGEGKKEIKKGTQK